MSFYLYFYLFLLHHQIITFITPLSFSSALCCFKVYTPTQSCNKKKKEWTQNIFLINFSIKFTFTSKVNPNFKVESIKKTNLVLFKNNQSHQNQFYHSKITFWCSPNIYLELVCYSFFMKKISFLNKIITFRSCHPFVTYLKKKSKYKK